MKSMLSKGEQKGGERMCNFGMKKFFFQSFPWSDSFAQLVVQTKLVGGFNPIEKNAHQIGSFPQVRVKIKNA